MTETKKKYARECKMKTVTFYKKDSEILAFANQINFQAFVKKHLKVEMIKNSNRYIKRVK